MMKFWAYYLPLKVRIKFCLWFLLLIVIIVITITVRSLPYTWARALTTGPTGIALSSVHISIKSTENYPVSRLLVLGMTWLQNVPSKNVFIVTDTKDNATMELANQGYNVYYSSCPTEKFHGRESLSCKCGDEFNLYYEQLEAGRYYSWYCHFDDDVYVNSPELQKLLSSFDHESIYYLGKRSLNHDIHVIQKLDHGKLIPIVKRMYYKFASGFAYCMSKKLMYEMESYARGKTFVANSNFQKKNDDITVGFIVEAVLGYNLTEIKGFNSHLHGIPESLPTNILPKQITISYKNISRINLPNGAFNTTMDPTRFLSYHCLLYPSVSWCVSHRLPNVL